MLFLKQSTASQSVLIGPFVDQADGNTVEDGLTISNTDIRLSKNGGNIAAKNSGGGTHDELGYYTITLDATDTDTVGRLQLVVHEAGALPVYHEFWVLEEAVYDELFGASALGYIANAPVNVAQFGGSNGTFASGIPAVNATQIEGSDATNQIRDAVVDDATRIDASALNTASGAIGSNGSGLTEAGGDGDHLTAINLPNQTMDIVGNITGNLSGSVGSVTGAVGSVTGAVGSVTGAVGSVTGNVGGNVTGSVGSLATQAKADVNAEVDAAIETYKLDHLVAVADADDPVDNSIIAKLAAKGATADWSSFVNTTDSQEAIRDRGDAAWVTATGFSTHSAADVWAAGTRTLTALDEDSTTIDLDGAIAAASQTGAAAALSAYDPPTKAEQDSAFTEIKGATWDSGTDTLEHIRNKETDIETDTQDLQNRVPAALVGGRIDATVDATGMETGAIDAILTRAMTEAYSTDGSTMTVAQALYEINQRLQEFAISGTSIVVKRRDGTTTALTLTLDDADAPTSSTRAS